MKEKDIHFALSIILFIVISFLIFIFWGGDMNIRKILCNWECVTIGVFLILFPVVIGFSIIIKSCNYTGETVFLSKEDLHYKYKFESAREIYIDKDVANIPYKYFSDFENLKCVVFEGENTAISPGAFEGCTSLERVYLPSKLKKIRNETFYGCSNLRSVIIPDSVTSIEVITFSGCDKVETLVIGDGITSFCGLPIKQSLKFILIGNGIKRIEYETFKDCINLTTVTIGSGVEEVGVRAFKNCKNLRSVTIPDNVTRIGKEAFKDCTNLISVTIGNGVKKIEKNTFSGCDKVETLIIGDGLTSLDNLHITKALKSIQLKTDIQLNIMTISQIQLKTQTTFTNVSLTLSMNV